MQDKKVQRELSIRSESVQRVYNFYVNRLFYVNRRYQRKLIWTEEEKRKFIDSIHQGYPVPIFLLAEVSAEGRRAFEIIDGMQRLNAIMSFIEGEYCYDGAHFDLNTMVESKSMHDSGALVQNEPVLDRSICEQVASYILPLSVYSFDDADRVDDIFRRINAGGKHLSRQELRAAGSLFSFADTVRQISSEIRTDVSPGTILPLDKMKEISITDASLQYGIPVGELFWVSNTIITKEMIRESRDEEIVSDIVACMALGDYPASSSQVLDEYYGLRDSERTDVIEDALEKRSVEVVRYEFLQVYDELRTVLGYSGKTFQQLVFRDSAQRLPRYFEVIFLAFHSLMFVKNKRVSDYSGLMASLEGIARHINITAGGNWSSRNKTDNINAIIGIIEKHFLDDSSDDPGARRWVTEFETILLQSKIEQNLYDFKQGFLSLDGSFSFNQNLVLKIVKTLAAMANKSASSTGYVCVGIPDKPDDVNKIKRVHGVQPREFHGFKITGIEHEPKCLNISLEDYFKKIIQEINKAPISGEYKSMICKHARVIRYYDKSILVFKVISTGVPAVYGGKYYIRYGADISEIPPEEYSNFFVEYSRGAT